MPRKSADRLAKYSTRARAIHRQMISILLDFEDVRTKSMFGHEGFFVHGNLFALFGEWGARSWKSDTAREACVEPDASVQDSVPRIILAMGTAPEAAELLQLKGAARFAPGGAPLKHWIVLPPGLVKAEDKLEAWLRRAYDGALAKPAKTLKSVPRMLSADAP